jgi:hypothetical protein
MKVFIVFMGILIINIGFLSYQGDMGRYVRCQNFLKATAEECAAGAALYYDEAAYSGGQLRFRYDEGRKYIEHILNQTNREMPLPRGSALTYEVAFQDDALGYEDVDNPSVTVMLTATTEDLFHLPFLKVTSIARTAKYELPQ